MVNGDAWLGTNSSSSVQTARVLSSKVVKNNLDYSRSTKKTANAIGSAQKTPQAYSNIFFTDCYY